MTLASGTRLGPYEITGVLGAGGMGEVYRARDPRLGRDVALKVLPEVFAADPDRLARFQREAQAQAALKHPNIGAIYGLEESAGEDGVPIRALVLELVDGDTLAERLARVGRVLSASAKASADRRSAEREGWSDPPHAGSAGPGLPVDEALPIAKQIAEALEAAHEQGVIHRDLKPSNIKITPDGLVKVLDFGLAKLTESAGSGPQAAGSAHLSLSPTVTSPAATALGVILGTAAYMAPEQAKGRPADKRSDVWAFGCVLYEMLTGKRAFEADDVSDTMALVLKGEPEWSALPSELPPSIRTLILACLEKDRRQRVADISSALFVLGHQADLAPPVVAPAPLSIPTPRVPAWRRIAAVAAFALTTAAVTAAGMWFATRPEASSVARFFVSPPENATFLMGGRSATSVVISPDGRMLAFTARDAASKVMLWVRPIDSLTAQPLAGTDDAQFPFWSPDSRFIGYFTQDKLLKIAASGGPPQTLCAVNQGRGGTWSREGQIVFGGAANAASLFRVSSAGGQPSAVTQLASGQQSHRFPSFLPDARHVLYYALAPEGIAGVHVASLDTSETRRIVEADSGGVYDSRNGYLLFGRQGTLLAQSFDPKTLALADEPFPIAERLESGAFAGVVAFSVSDNGALAYGVGSSSGNAGLQMVWVDRQGMALGTVGPTGNYRGLDLAPDGKRVAAHRHDGQGGDIWATEMSRATTSRFTFDAAQDTSSPVWSPDGSRIVFGSLRAGKWGLYAKPSNGAGGEERLIESQVVVLPVSWAPDGHSIVYVQQDPKTNRDVWLLPLSGDRKPVPLVMTPFADTHAQISPDGKWLAYASTETGQPEIFVRPFPAGDGKWQVSTGGGLVGFFPRWRGDGRELFYMDNPNGAKLMAVDVRSGGSAFEAGTPRPLFDSGYVDLAEGGRNYHTYAVSADGQRFLIPRAAATVTQYASPPIAVVLNWAEGIRH